MNQPVSVRRRSWRTSVRARELDDTLEAFVNSLRRDGFAVPIDTASAATGIFLDELTRSPDDLSNLKYRLTPLFATSEASQRNIAERIDRFVSERNGGAAPAATDHDERAPRGAFWIPALLSLALAIALLGWRGPLPIQAPPKPNLIEERSRPTTTITAPTPDYPKIERDPRSRDLPTQVFVPREMHMTPWAVALLVGGIAMPLLIFALWWLLRLQARRGWMRVSSYDHDWPRIFAREIAREEIPISNDLGRTGAQLNIKAGGETDILDLRRTVVATARAAGFVTPVYEEARAAADYVVLIQRLGPNDHLAQVTDIMLDRIEKAGVTLRRYYYRKDPRFCHPDPDARHPIPFRDLARQFGRHRFLVIGSPDGFFHPTTGDFVDWREAENVFLSRALLTSRRPEQWSYPEDEMTRQGFFVSTASPSGIAAYGGAVSAGTETMPVLRRPGLYGRKIQENAIADAAPERPPDRSAIARIGRVYRESGLLGVAANFRSALRAAPTDLGRSLQQYWARVSQIWQPALVALGLVIVAAIGGTTMLAWVVPTTTSIQQTTFRDCPNCPEMIALPGGTFTMGSPETEEGRDGDEGPQRQVTIAPFALAATEVTFDQWQACVDGGGCQSNPTPSDEGWGHGTRPVINVSWDDAQEYITWLNTQVEGADPYRLPTEAEWEFAARAGTMSRFFWGDDPSATEQCKWANGADQTALKENSDWTVSECADGHVNTSPVGSFEPNDFGLRDMSGNVWEWVEDCWHDTYSGAPTDGSAWLSEQGSNCSLRVLRGGSWFNVPQILRSADRYWDDPDGRYLNIGFRPARTLLTP